MFCIFLLCFALPSFAQNERFKQMESDIESPKTPDTTRLRYMICMIDSIYDASVWEPLNERAYDLAAKLSVHADAKHRYWGKLFLADAMNNRGFANKSRGNINKALELYFQALRLREDISYEIGIASSYNNLADIFSNQGDTIRALQYHYKSMDIREKLQDQHGIAQSLNNIGQTYLSMNKIDKSLPYLNKSIEMFREIGGQGGLGKALYTLSLVQFYQKKYIDARQSLEESLHILYDLHDDENIALTILQIGNIDFEENKTKGAEEKCKQVIIISQAGQFLAIEGMAYRLLSRIFEHKGNHERALEFYKKHIEIKEKINNISIQNYTAQYQYAYEYAKKDAIAYSEKAQLKKDSNLKIIIYSLAAFGFFLLSSILLYFYRLRLKASKILEEKNKQIELALTRAETSERFKSQFLSNVSHEIRTPMNAIFGMSNLLTDTPLDVQQKSYLSAINNSSENLLLIINDVLDFSKLEAGKMILEQTPFQISKVIDDVHNTLQFKAQEKGLTFSCKKDEKINDYLLGDGFRIYQVLINLVSNAIKFTEKGNVEVNVECSEDSENKQKIKFSVKDTGVGIPKNKLQNIFESFQQASNDIARQYGGTGLGLSISQQLVALRNGKIEVESEPSKGSLFYFTLEYDKSDKDAFEKAHGTPKIEDPQKLKNLKILLAEDNEYNRILAVDSLKKTLRHVTIHEVETGAQVLKAVMDYDYDLILMDINMPEMNGYEATIQIRSFFPADKKDIPIIALTAYSREEEEKKCYEVGMNNLVTKPFKMHQLLNAITKIISLKSSEIIDNQEDTTKNQPLQNESVDFTFMEDFTENTKEDMVYFIQKFIQTIPSAIEKLSVAIAENDAVKIKKTAHTIKPQIEFVGIKKALENVKILEEKIAESNYDIVEIETLFNDICKNIDEGKIILANFSKN